MNLQELITELQKIDDKQTMVYLEIGDGAYAMLRNLYIEGNDLTLTANRVNPPQS